MGKSPAYLVFLICKDSSQAGGLADSEMRNVSVHRFSVQGSGLLALNTPNPDEPEIRNSKYETNSILLLSWHPCKAVVRTSSSSSYSSLVLDKVLIYEYEKYQIRSPESALI